MVAVVTDTVEAPPTSMRALVLEDYGRMAVVDRPVPEPGDGEVLIRVRATGICGSDLHGFTGENGRRTPGQVMGHETVGTVAAHGPAVEYPAIGDVVVVNPTLACGTCPECRDGMAHICSDRRVIGVDPAISSGFADYLVVPAANAVPFGSTPLHGALVEPLAVGFHAAVRGEVTDADDVLVLGGGPIGQAAALACQRLGAATVTLSEPLAARRALVESLDVPAVDSGSADVVAEAKARTGGRGVAVSIDAVGSTASLRAALDATAPGGRCVLVGMANPNVELGAFAVSTLERSVVGAFCYTRDEFAATAAWAESVPDLLTTLISVRITPEEAPAAFSALARGDHPAGKVLVDFGEGTEPPHPPHPLLPRH